MAAVSRDELLIRVSEAMLGSHLIGDVPEWHMTTEAIVDVVEDILREEKRRWAIEQLRTWGVTVFTQH